MKIIRKKEIKKIKIIHNKKLFWIIILLLILLGFLIYFMVHNNKTSIANESECSIDADCVPVCGCHPDRCITKLERSECGPVTFCTQVCSGPLDCGAGICGCVNNKCKIVPGE